MQLVVSADGNRRHAMTAPLTTAGEAGESDRKLDVRSGGFTIVAEDDPARITVRLTGELDLASAPALEQAIMALPCPDLAELVFDLGQLTFIDSTGLRVLFRASQLAATAELRVAVTRVHGQPLKLFTLTGVTDRLNLQP